MTTAVFGIWPPNAIEQIIVNTPAPEVERLTSGTWLHLRGTANGGGPDDWGRVEVFANGFGDPVPNQVMRFGPNMQSGGGRVDPNYGALGVELESYFRKSAGERVQEAHLVAYPKTGTTRRLLSTYSEQTSGVNSWVASSDFIGFANAAGTLLGEMDSNILWENGGLFGRTYNVPLLAQNNSTNSAFLELLKLGAGYGGADCLVIGNSSGLTRVEILRALAVIPGTAGTDLVASLASTNGSCAMYVTSGDPSGTLSAPGGSIAFRISGATSGIYINRTAGTGTSWSLVTAVP